MLEWIRGKMMIRIQIKKEGMEKYNHSITPTTIKLLEQNMHDSRHCFAHYVGDMKFEVDYYDITKVVDLGSHTCSYRNWDLLRIPYKHAIVAIQMASHDPKAYVHAWFSKDLYLKTYSFAIYLVPDKGE